MHTLPSRQFQRWLTLNFLHTKVVTPCQGTPTGLRVFGQQVCQAGCNTDAEYGRSAGAVCLCLQGLQFPEDLRCGRNLNLMHRTGNTAPGDSQIMAFNAVDNDGHFAQKSFIRRRFGDIELHGLSAVTEPAGQALRCASISAGDKDATVNSLGQPFTDGAADCAISAHNQDPLVFARIIHTHSSRNRSSFSHLPARQQPPAPPVPQTGATASGRS